MYLKKYLLLSVLFCVSVWQLSAQTTFTLQEVYKELEDKNSQLTQARIRESLAEQDVKDAKNDLLPTAGMSVSNNYNYGLSFDQVAGQLVSGNRWSHSASAGVQASLTLFDGFQSFAKIKMTSLQRESAALQTISLRRTLRLEAAAVFFDILANEALYKASLAHLKISQTLFEEEKIKFDTGLKTKVDLALAESRVAGDETNTLISSNAYLSKLMDLKQLMNLPLADSIRLLTSEETEPAVFDKTAYDIEASTEVVLALQGMAQSQLEYKMARSRYYPQVGLNGSYGTNYSSERTHPVMGGKMSLLEQMGQNKFLYLGVSLTMPLFDAFKARSGVQKAKLDIQLRKSEWKKIRTEEEKMWEKAWQEYHKSLAEYSSLQRAFTSSSASYEAMKERYEVGMASYFELSTTLMEKNISEFNLITARYNLMYAQEVINLLLKH